MTVVNMETVQWGGGGSVWLCGFGFVKVMYVFYLNKPLLLSFKVYSIRRVKDRAQGT